MRVTDPVSVKGDAMIKHHFTYQVTVTVSQQVYRCSVGDFNTGSGRRNQVFLPPPISPVQMAAENPSQEQPNGDRAADSTKVWRKRIHCRSVDRVCRSLLAPGAGL